MTGCRLLAVGALLVLAACGSDDQPGAQPGAPATTTTSSAPSGTDSGRGSPVTARGTVSKGVEAGCLVFTPENASDGPWLLIGNTDGLSDGDTVTVRGLHRNDVATTCMQGMPFEVDQVLER